MHRFRRRLYSLSWCLVLGFLAVVEARACMGHPAAHEVEHPVLCLDSSSPVAHEQDKPVLFADAGACPLPADDLTAVGFLAATSTSLSLGFDLVTHPLSRFQQSPSLSLPQDFLSILRL
ncbi:MAG: hypothetical protein ACREOH_09790 [Candidatus Entotheonellia bacterium]